MTDPTQVMHIRINQAALASIKKKAKAKDISVAAYVRLVLNGHIDGRRGI